MILFADIGPKFKYASSGLKFKISSTGHLQCITPESIPLPKISWYKDGKEITGYNNQSQLFGDGKSLTITLELSNFGLKDMGSYQCKAENELLGITRESHLINVTVKGLVLFIVFTLEFRKWTFHSTFHEQLFLLVFLLVFRFSI